MLTKTQAIVLHSLKYGETRLIVDMFTRSYGRLSFIVSLPKSPKGQKLSDARLLHPFSTIPFSQHKLSISLFVAEFLYYALRGEQQNALLFDYVIDSIQWLDGQDIRFANFHLVFLMRLSRFLGFYPNLDDYSAGDYFDLRESVFLPAPPVHRDFLQPEEAQKVQLMMRMDYATMHLFQMSHTERNRLLEVALTYYRLHLPDFPELKSLSVLQELYA